MYQLTLTFNKCLLTDQYRAKYAAPMGSSALNAMQVLYLDPAVTLRHSHVMCEQHIFLPVRLENVGDFPTWIDASYIACRAAMNAAPGLVSEAEESITTDRHRAD